MSSNFRVSGTDFDALFATRSGSSPRSNTGFKVSGTDIADRYHASTGGDAGSSSGFKVSGTDLGPTLRYLGYVPPAPSTYLTGPSDVYDGTYGADTWSFGATTGVGLLEVRFQVDGHGSGAWVPASGGSYSNTSTWSDPYASPSISHSPGTYLFYFEAKDTLGQVGRSELYVTVH